MDRGLLIAALALGACRGASAASSPPSYAPAGWIELPSVAKAARAQPGMRAAAWGDPAAGCYLVIASATGAKEDAATAQALLDGELAHGDLAGVTGLRGKTRGWSVASGDDVVSTAAACVYNDREPAACAAACDAAWSKLSGPPVIP
jgi:hypothetical protein